MILDSESQRNLFLAILSEHTFAIPGKALVQVANEIQTLVNAITTATLSEEETDVKTHTQEADEEAEA